MVGALTKPETTELSTRLRRIAAELAELEQELVRRHKEIDNRVAHDFRQTVDHLRLTAAAIEQCAGRTLDERSPLLVFSRMVPTPIFYATQLNYSLTSDVDAGRVSESTHGLEKLLRSMEDLSQRLVSLLPQGEPREDMKLL